MTKSNIISIADKEYTEKLENVEDEDDKEIEIVPNAMFPFCAYNNDYSEGILAKEYDERFCNSFQVIL